MEHPPNDEWLHQIAEWIAGTFAALMLWVLAFVRKKLRRLDNLEKRFVTHDDFERHKLDRKERDHEVDRKLDKIDETTTRTHERIDDLYRDTMRGQR